MRRKRGKFVGMRAEGKLRQLRDFLGGALGEFGRGVQSRAYRRSSYGQIVKTIQRLLQAVQIALQQASPPRKLLAHSDGRSVFVVDGCDIYRHVTLVGFFI